MIVPTKPILINKYPKEAQSKKAPGDNGRCKAKKCLNPAYRFLIKSQNFYVPCTQAQCLAAMRPEPAVKREADDRQVNTVN